MIYQPITFCISTFNNLPYLKLAIKSVRENSFFKNAPFIIHSENCTDGTNEWLLENESKYNLTCIIEDNEIPIGIGGGMNVCADKVQTEYIMFLHSDMYVSKNWDKALYDLIESKSEELGDNFWLSSHRIEPNIFNNHSNRPGTAFVDTNTFGCYYYDFQEEEFKNYASEFVELNKDYSIPKGEGVSGLISKKSWDLIGGNDPIFAPASWEDMDLFLRMLQKDFKFLLSGKSLVWHFAARGSHRLEENGGKSSERQMKAEYVNRQKFINKWGGLPTFNEYGMIVGLK